MKLSLGCGRQKKEGFEGLDSVDFGWNKVCDIGTQIFPYADNSVEYIELHNTLEHIERKQWRHLFNECWRVLKVNGVLDILAPDYEKSPALAWQDPTHLSAVIRGTFTSYLTGARPRNADYGFKHWIIMQIEDDPKDPRSMHVLMKPNKQNAA